MWTAITWLAASTSRIRMVPSVISPQAVVASTTGSGNCWRKTLSGLCAHSHSRKLTLVIRLHCARTKGGSDEPHAAAGALLALARAGTPPGAARAGPRQRRRGQRPPRQRGRRGWRRLVPAGAEGPGDRGG